MPEFEFLLNLRDTSNITKPHREQSTTEILIRHLLARLCQNELVSIDGDMSRALQTAWAAAVPQVVAVLLLFVVYHAAGGPPRSFWPQAGDHFFFVIYALFIMGAVAIYSWDVLYPDALDVFVLGALPIPSRKLLSARIVAVSIFLLVALLGTSFLGDIFMPLMADQPHVQWHLLAHITAIVMAGTFSAGTVLAVQGILLVAFSERTFQRLTPALQTFGMLLLFTMLFSFPHMADNLQILVTKSWANDIPPLWFLGLYERIMHGTSTPVVFNALALRGLIATITVSVVTCITYPIAYRRKVKLVMEGTVQLTRNRKLFAPLTNSITSILCPNSRQRGIFHFISQTLWRSRRPRTMMAIFLSVGTALAMVRLVPLSSHTVQLALITVTFFTLFGLRAAFASPVDLRGTWLFRALLGRETGEVLDVQKRWTLIAVLTVSTTFTLLFAASHLLPVAAIAPTLLVLTAFALVTTDLYGRKTTAIPFTEARKTTHSERPLAAARYLIVFPLLLNWMPIWMSMPWPKLLVFAAITGLTHLLLLRTTSNWRANDFTGNLDESDPDAFPTSLGLRE